MRSTAFLALYKTGLKQPFHRRDVMIGMFGVEPRASIGCQVFLASAPVKLSLRLIAQICVPEDTLGTLYSLPCATIHSNTSIPTMTSSRTDKRCRAGWQRLALTHPDLSWIILREWMELALQLNQVGNLEQSATTTTAQIVTNHKLRHYNHIRWYNALSTRVYLLPKL